MYTTNMAIKFADGTTVIGLITTKDETAYRTKRPQFNAVVSAQKPLSQHYKNQGAELLL